MDYGRQWFDRQEVFLGVVSCRGAYLFVGLSHMGIYDKTPFGHTHK